MPGRPPARYGLGRIRPLVAPRLAAHMQQHGGEVTPSYALSTLTAASATGVADGSTPNTLTLTARNTSNALMSGKAVTWTRELTAVSAGQSSVSATGTITNDGVDVCTITFIARNAAGVVLPNIAAARCVIAVTGASNTITQPAATTTTYGAGSGSFVSTAAATKTVSVTIDGTLITQTVSVVVTGSSILYPNEPGGYSLISVADGSVARGGGSEAFGFAWMGAWYTGVNPSSAVAVVADATNPVGSGNVVRFLYTSASSEPKCATAGGTMTGGPFAQFYLGMHIYFEAAWDGYALGKFFYLGIPSTTGASLELYLTREADGSMHLTHQGGLQVTDNWINTSGSSEPLAAESTWHLVELLLDADALTASLYVNDVLIASLTGLDFDLQAMSELEWYATGGTTGYGTAAYRLGGLRLSGVV